MLRSLKHSPEEQSWSPEATGAVCPMIALCSFYGSREEMSVEDLMANQKL